MKLHIKIFFYVLSCTWGAILTLFGCLGALLLLMTEHKPKKFHHVIYFEVGEGWGGLEAGTFFFCSKGSNLHLKQHETGHGFQNAVLGPFCVFLITLPSASRYWLREFKTRKTKQLYSIVLYICLLVLSIISSVVAIFTQPWVFIIAGFIFIYSTILCSWLLFIETPKYDKGYVDYDSVWFEGQATRLGKKYCPDEVETK